MDLKAVKKLKLPSAPGCYQFIDKQGRIIYIGKAVNLKNRVLSYWQKGSELTPAKQLMLTKIEQLDWITTDSEIEALLLEANLIKKYQPYYNVNLKDDKRFIYIWVSTADEVPGVFATRQLTKGGRYFGPFVSTRSVRETLKAIRKIWPFCTQRKVGKIPCFYYQLGRCVGVCGGKVSVAEYKRAVIKPIVEFLEGNKNRIITNYELRITNLEKLAKRGKLSEREMEELAQLKFQLMNMKQVLANARVLSVGEKYAADVVELAKILNLARVPERIEGYDLSNIFGQEAVGSMVVFANGEPDKNEYRKFKIQLSLRGASATRQSRGDGIATLPAVARDDKRGDVQMLEEMLLRRFNNDWPLPDLIIVDGGKAQLNTALKVLKKFKLDILAIAISKGEGLRSSIAPDKIFFPGQAQPLQLPLNSPALHLIKRVRDEAHRFAISYHRKLRSKKFLQ
jgi:excinuclease ABC subunit C